MSTLVCRSSNGGCGHVGEGKEWKNAYDDPDGCDIILCPCCRQDHAMQVTKDNLNKVEDEPYYVVIVNRLVTEGQLTKEEADYLIEKHNEEIEDNRQAELEVTSGEQDIDIEYDDWWFNSRV